ncbi:transcriptional regulatory protein GlnR [Streptomyces camponoticapitis]|uniref:Transcriptional regulatory protein GlnR n=1 Tax=Streptomyces camponoticapitis TaxID=1616125 RepID=A0ABQ2EP87_9ACTN|nr:response regulator transcription factor [Streptomyces camponoticapitis]GGK18961.1 transcriptional regulatory protein GlnR [Streptomyces camponoticapitis]
MSSLLLLTNALQPSTEVLPALGLLLHHVRVAPAEGPALVDTPGADVILIDGRRDLPQVRSLCQLLRSTGPGCPLVLVVTEGGLTAVTADWGFDDVLLDTAGPAEVEARLRLVTGRQQISTDDSPMEIRNGDLSVDEATYSAKLKGRVLDLTFKEFELIKYLAQHPGRVFTRAQLLQEVWGYDYFGGTRTVDVHVRRLRAKLGPEHESLIGTVRNVGYRFVTPEKVERAAEEAKAKAIAEAAAKVKATRPPAEAREQAPDDGGEGSREAVRSMSRAADDDTTHSVDTSDVREGAVRPAGR